MQIVAWNIFEFKKWKYVATIDKFCIEMSEYNRENRFIVEKEGKIKCLKVLWLFSVFFYNGKLIKSKLAKNFQIRLLSERYFTTCFQRRHSIILSNQSSLFCVRLE